MGPPYSPAEPILAQLDQLFRSSSQKSQTGTSIYIYVDKKKEKNVTSGQSLNFLPPQRSWIAGLVTENSRTISWSSVAVCGRLLTPMSR